MVGNCDIIESITINEKENIMAKKKKKVHFVTNKVTGKRTGFMPRMDTEEQALSQVRDAIGFCVEEFRAKHGDTKAPEIEIQMNNGLIEVRAKNY